jgi:hypothetical protein
MTFGGKEGALEHFLRVGTRHLRERGCARVFWSSRYVECDGKEGVLEYYSQVGTQNIGNKGALECFRRVSTWNLRERRAR